MGWREATDLHLKHLIQRDDDTPDAIVATCEAWFNGARSAMKRFVDRQPVSPLKLAQEARRYRVDNMQGSEEDARLDALNDWASAQSDMCVAAVALVEAKAAFDGAAERCGLNPHRQMAVWDRLTGGGR